MFQVTSSFHYALFHSPLQVNLAYSMDKFRRSGVIKNHNRSIKSIVLEKKQILWVGAGDFYKEWE